MHHPVLSAKDRIIASVKGDRSKVYEFVDDYGSTNSEDPEDVEFRFIHIGQLNHD